MKFATLTLGGDKKRAEYLQSDGNYDLVKMHEDMSEGLHKMIMALKKRFGRFHYFKVVEPHQDGVPHYHILFVGNACIPRHFLGAMEKLWQQHYGFGWVKLNRIRWADRRHAINYILKYLTKNPKKPGFRKRLFTVSKGSLEPTHKKQWEITQIILGRVDDTGQIIEETIPEPVHGDLIEIQGPGHTIHLMTRADYIDMRMNVHLTTLIERRHEHA
jgi:hypothetical protein